MLLANTPTTPEAGQVLMYLVGSVMSLLVMADYVKRLFFAKPSREDQCMPRAEVESKVSRLTERIVSLEKQTKDILDTMGELRVDLVRLVTVMEETLRRPRGEE